MNYESHSNSISKSLSTDMELFAAALSQSRIAVWSKTADDIYALLETDGIIEKYTSTSVKINNKQYERDECEFRVQL